MSKQPEADWSDWQHEETPEEKTKSQIKREATALQEMGEELLKLPVSQIEKMPMSDMLREALLKGKSITSNNAYARQLQFIGKVMREEPVEPLQRALDELRYAHQHQAQQFHIIERWRDRLLAEGDTAINAILDEYPTLDRQQLRQLVRQAHKEQKENKPPAAARELFKVLRSQIES